MHLYTIDCGRFLPCILPLTLLILIPDFHSLESNKVGDSGASALASALTVNQGLKTLK